jgi:hypothetical protein
VYATEIPATQTELKAQIEAYDKVQDVINEETDSDVKSAMTYYFRTGKTTAFDNAYKKELYDENQKARFDEFVARFGADAKEEDKLTLESEFIGCVSKVTSADKSAIDKAWANTLPTPEVKAETKKGLETWAIVLIVVGSVIVAAGIAVGVIFLVKAQNKKKEAARKAAETVNLAKRKIDTTDDKSIDVYADETETVETEEVSEENVEEVVEAEEVAEEAVEEAAEVEATEEAAEEPKQD